MNHRENLLVICLLLQNFLFVFSFPIFEDRKLSQCVFPSQHEAKNQGEKIAQQIIVLWISYTFSDENIQSMRRGFQVFLAMVNLLF